MIKNDNLSSELEAKLEEKRKDFISKVHDFVEKEVRFAAHLIRDGQPEKTEKLSKQNIKDIDEELATLFGKIQGNVESKFNTATLWWHLDKNSWLHLNKKSWLHLNKEMPYGRVVDFRRNLFKRLINVCNEADKKLGKILTNYGYKKSIKVKGAKWDETKIDWPGSIGNILDEYINDIKKIYPEDGPADCVDPK